MFFKQVVQDHLGCASYMVASSDSGECAVVDPRWEIEPYLQEAERRGLRITHIIETHNHADHVSGHGRLANATGASIYIHELAGVDYPHRRLVDGQVLRIGELQLEVLHTPGHRPEHICLSVADTTRSSEPWLVLSGDLLLVGDVGRPDLAVDGQEGARQAFHSLHERLLHLPDFVEVFPAHVAGSLCGRISSTVNSSTLGFEHRFSQALAFSQPEDFVTYMNEGLPVRPPTMTAILEKNRGPLEDPALDLRGVSPEEAESHMGSEAVLLDVRPTTSYLAHHPQRSIHVPIESTQFGNRVGFLVATRAPILIIADDEAQAAQAATILKVVGYEEVGAYILMADWLAAGRPIGSTPSMTPEELRAALLADGSALGVLDVREPNEWEAGHIDGASLVPYRAIKATPPPYEPSAELVVICNSGERSAVAASVLEEQGFTNVTNVTTGMTVWQALGYPVRRE